MKRLGILLLCLITMFPMMGMAAPSKSTQDLIYCEPEMPFNVIDDFNLIELEDYEIVEVLEINLEHEYEIVKWHLPIELTPTDDVKVAIMGESIIFQNTLITKKGNILIDFTDLEPGAYILYFFKHEIS